MPPERSAGHGVPPSIVLIRCSKIEAVTILTKRVTKDNGAKRKEALEKSLLRTLIKNFLCRIVHLIKYKQYLVHFQVILIWIFGVENIASWKCDFQTSNNILQSSIDVHSLCYLRIFG